MVKDLGSVKWLGTSGQGLWGGLPVCGHGHAGKILGGTWVKSLLLHLLVCNSGPITLVARVPFPHM